LTEKQIDEAFLSHQIAPDTLKVDDFNAFIVDRAKRLLRLIELAMGKTVSGKDSESTIQNYGEALV